MRPRPGWSYTPSVLLGRDSEREAVSRLVATARLGVGGTLVLMGEPGVGKTALLEDTLASLGEMRVLRATGLEAERHIPFAGLLQLLRPALASSGRSVHAPGGGAVRRPRALGRGNRQRRPVRHRRRGAQSAHRVRRGGAGRGRGRRPAPPRPAFGRGHRLRRQAVGGRPRRRARRRPHLRGGPTRGGPSGGPAFRARPRRGSRPRDADGGRSPRPGTPRASARARGGEPVGPAGALGRRPRRPRDRPVRPAGAGARHRHRGVRAATRSDGRGVPHGTPDRRDLWRGPARDHPGLREPGRRRRSPGRGGGCRPDVGRIGEDRLPASAGAGRGLLPRGGTRAEGCPSSRGRRPPRRRPGPAGVAPRRGGLAAATKRSPICSPSPPSARGHARRTPWRRVPSNGRPG